LTTPNPLYRAREMVSHRADAGAKVLFYHPMVRPVVDEAKSELLGVTGALLAHVGDRGSILFQWDHWLAQGSDADAFQHPLGR
jgi:hypothetical protein